MGRNEETDRFFSAVTCNKSKGNRHKLKKRQEIQYEHKKVFFCQEGDQILEQAAHKGGHLIHRDIQKPIEHGPGQHAVSDFLGRVELDWVISVDSFQP